MESVRTDRWEVIRVQDMVACGRIKRRRRRAAQVGDLLGAGYTPRIVFLAGLMLRSLQLGTKLRHAFNPSLGYAAGATLAAWFAKREWLSCMMLGWGAGGVYWSSLRVHPP